MNKASQGLALVVRPRPLAFFAVSVLSGLVFMAAPSARATDGNWAVDALGNWNTPTNWSSNPTVPGGAGSTVGLTFNITAARAVTIDTTSATVGILNIGDPTATVFAYTLAASGGASLIMDNSGAGAQINHASTGGADIVSAPISLNDNLTVANASASAMALSGGVTSTGTKNITFNANAAGGFTVSTGSVNNTGTITNSGSGAGTTTISGALGANVTGVTQNSATSTLTLSGANSSFTGPITLTAGTLKLGSATALGTGGALSIAAGTTLDASATTTISTVNAQNWNGNFTFGGNFALNTGTGAISLGAGSVQLTNAGATSLTVGGAVTGTSNLTLTSNAAGGLIFNAGFGNTGTITHSGTGTGGTAINNAIASSVSGITQNSSTSPLSLTNTSGTANSYTGTTTLSAGTLNATNSSAAVASSGTFSIFGTSALVLNAGSLNLFGNLSGNGGTFAVANNVTIGSGNVAINVDNTAGGSFFFNNTFSFNGTNNIGSGVLSVTGGHTYQLKFAGTTTLTANATFNPTTAPLTFSTVIGDGSNGYSITKNGTGTLTMTAVNTYGGGTVINQGTLSLSNGGTLGAGALQVNNTNTGAGNSVALTLAASTNTTTGSLSGTIATPSSGTNNATITTQSTRTFIVNQTAAGTYQGVIAGSGSFALGSSSNNTLTLAGANTYTGTTSIQNGILSVSSLNKVTGGTASSSLGAPITVANGTIAMGSTTNTGQLTYAGTGETTDRVINLAGTTGGATLDQSGTGLLKFTSAFTATGAGIKVLTLQGSTAGTGEIGGAIIDNSVTNTTTVTKTGTGTWTLSGTNTYTGATNVNGGTLALGSSGALGTSGTISFGGGTLQHGASNTTDYSARFSTAAGQAYSVDTNGQAVTWATALTSVGGSLTKTGGSGTLTLSNANTYAGGTNINAGTLSVSGSLADAGAVTVGGGTYDVAVSDTVGAVTLTSGTISGAGTLSGSSYGVQSGTINAVLGGSGALAKTTAGTVTFNSASTYSGNTTISAGTLALGASASIANSPVINLGTSGSQGTLDLTAKSSFTFGSAQTLSGYGTVNIGAGKTITINGNLTPGNSPGLLTVTGDLALGSGSTTTMELAGKVTPGTDYDKTSISGAVTFGGTLNIVGFGGYNLGQAGTYDLFGFGSESGNFTLVSVGGTALTDNTTSWSATNLNGNGFDYTFTLATGDLVVIATAIPEPSTYAAIFGALALAGMVCRRRRSRSN